MNKEIAEMIEEKRLFIKSIETMLATDQKNNQVDCLEYKVVLYETEDHYDEYINIIYTDGHIQPILATGNSNGANLKAIAMEVY